jgi:List-Bact-rpt repeat protein
MRMARLRTLFALIVAASLAGAAYSTPVAQAAVSDPLFVFVPNTPKGSIFAIPPPAGFLEGPCGMGVDASGRFYVSDYYHDVVDVYDQNATYTGPKVTGQTGYLSTYFNIDSIDGPCGLALDDAGSLFVNDYHRAVFRGGVPITGAMVDGSHPTGVAVEPVSGYAYVDERTYVGVFDDTGAPVMDGVEPLRIGCGVVVEDDSGVSCEGSLQDGYGVALSQYPGTEGRLYVPDNASGTIKVYDPAVDADDPIEVIDGSETPRGEFVSLRDTAVAVDRVSGDIYVVDNMQPEFTEQPQAIVQVFDSSGAYLGHLKYLVTHGMPTGLAVDNSETATQGRVYVTSGNSVFGAIYAYAPGAATTEPTKFSTSILSIATKGTGNGTVSNSLSSSSCDGVCEEEVPAGATAYLSADPSSGSTFAGWTGACTGSATICEVELDEAAGVRAAFDADTAAQPEEASPIPSAAVPVAPAATTRHRARRCGKHGHRGHRCKLRHRTRHPKGKR